jgi:hypothetical protein
MGAFKAFYGVGMLVGFLLWSLFYLFGGVFSAFALMSLLIVLFIPFGLKYVPSENEIDLVKDNLMKESTNSDSESG